MRRLLRLFALLAVATACLPVAPAAAIPFPVTSTDDVGGKETLREAILAANLRMGPDTIPIEVEGTIGLEEALPTITDSVAIIGPGADLLTVERAVLTPFRIFDFASGITSSLGGLTVRGGVAEAGGGIFNGSGSLALTGVVVRDNEAFAADVTSVKAEGGGVFSDGPLIVRESVIQDNSAIADSGTSSTYARGGGILASDSVTVDRSTISGNAAEAHGEGGNHSGALGGGLRTSGELAIVERSTISGNSVVADNSQTNEARGGGLNGSELELTSSTVAGNSLISIGFKAGANIEFSGTTLVRNTIVADAIGDDESCGTPATSGGFNLDEDGSCGFEQATDLTGVDAGLDPVLQANGGPTPTHALLLGSPAIDRGKAFGSAVDQRGLPRPSDFPTIGNAEGGDGSDIGAFELQVPPPAAVQVTPVASDRQAPNTRIVSGPPRSSFKRLAKFRFASTEPQSTFQCKVDKRRWRGCSNPFKRKVKAGAKHVFKVRAIDRFGNVDPTPARFGWRVKKIVG
jgi:hypothetical protein